MKGRRICIIAGIVVNVGLSYLMYRIGMPMYLDTLGTISVACLCGALPGIVVAVATNLLCSLFNGYAMYFSVLNVLIAICAAYYSGKGKLKRLKGILCFILTAAVIGGGLGTVFQWLLIGGPQYSDISDAMDTLSAMSHIPAFPVFLILNLLLNIVDKGIVTWIALLIMRFIPEAERYNMYNGNWKQTPLTEAEIKALKKRNEGVKYPIRKRITVILIVTSLSLVILMAWVGIKLFYDSIKEEKTASAMNAVRLTADILDPDMIDVYLRDGEDAPGYNETKKLLYELRDVVTGVKYLYVLDIENDGCHVVFDLDAEDVKGLDAGTILPFEEAFEPYLPALFAGEEIEPIESNDISGWVLTVYYPVKNDAGRTVCYVGADVSLDYMTEYTRGFMLKVLLVLAGFFVLILAYGMTSTGVNMVYPISSISTGADAFMKNIADSSSLDEDVAKLKRLDIHTDDEIENLYGTLCDLTENFTNQIKDIRHYSEAVAKMQNGLIITMADMVENRDANTGAHIQKTAEYVRIILKGLQRKGYYAQKLTPKYISDVEMSAPLHDVGKINIPDAILNKPGKLTPEEYEIMKTHTTAGKQILEKAISTVSGENYLKEARNMAAYHHEKWNGKGYPEGLRGEVIPLSARVMAVADVFDALMSRRVYKPPMPLEKALSIITEGSGEDFDPKCVEVFMDSLDEVKRVLKKYQEY